MNPNLSSLDLKPNTLVMKTFRLKQPTPFYMHGKRVILRSLAVAFAPPHVQWLSQTIQLDAKAGIYDYVRGRVRLAPGNNSYTIHGIDFAHAVPLSSPPSISELGVGLMPGEIDLALTDVQGAVPSQGTPIAKLDDLIVPEDLRLKMTPAEFDDLSRSRR